MLLLAETGQLPIQSNYAAVAVLRTAIKSEVSNPIPNPSVVSCMPPRKPRKSPLVVLALCLKNHPPATDVTRRPKIREIQGPSAVSNQLPERWSMNFMDATKKPNVKQCFQLTTVDRNNRAPSFKKHPTRMIVPKKINGEKLKFIKHSN